MDGDLTGDPGRGVDSVLRSLIPKSVKPDSAEARVLRLYLGLEDLADTESAWPSNAELGRAVEVTAGRVGQILPKAVLDLPPLGCVNVHASLLPRWRGAAPIQAALLAGDTVTGVTTMLMDEGLDTGDILLQRPIPIDPADDAGTLHDKLAAAGAELLVETLALLAEGRAPRRPQDNSLATYAPKIEREQAAIDWSRTAEQIYNHVRAFAPWPGAYTAHGERILKVLAVEPRAAEAAGAAPGEVVAVEEAGFVVQTGRGTVLVRCVKPPGAAAMSGRDYVNGYRLRVGERLAPVQPGAGADGAN